MIAGMVTSLFSRLTAKPRIKKRERASASFRQASGKIRSEAGQELEEKPESSPAECETE